MIGEESPAGCGVWPGVWLQPDPLKRARVAAELSPEPIIGRTGLAEPDPGRGLTSSRTNAR